MWGSGCGEITLISLITRLVMNDECYSANDKHIALTEGMNLVYLALIVRGGISSVFCY